MIIHLITQFYYIYHVFFRLMNNELPELQSSKLNISHKNSPSINEKIDKFPEETNTNTDPFQLLKKLAEDSSFKGDLEALLSYFSHLKSQRDHYWLLLEQITSKTDPLDERGHKIGLLELLKEKDGIQGTNGEYGKGAELYIDRLNLQIDMLKNKMLEENSFLKEKDVLSSKVSCIKIKEVESVISKDVFNELSFEDIVIKNRGKTHQKWISMDLNQRNLKEYQGIDNSLRSISDIQMKLGYFPLRIKDLEEDNARMAMLIMKLQEESSDLKMNFYELNEKQKEIDKINAELTLQRKIIEEKEKVLETKIITLTTQESGEIGLLSKSPDSHYKKFIVNTKGNDEKAQKDEKTNKLGSCTGDTCIIY